MSSEWSLYRDKLEKEKKKDLDRLKKDLSELTERPPDVKRSRLESSVLSSASHTPSPTPSREAGDIDMEHEEEEVSEAGDSAGDLEMNLEDQFDCSCCVCKSFSQESGNKPRLTWNCSKCSNKYDYLMPILILNFYRVGERAWLAASLPVLV